MLKGTRKHLSAQSLQEEIRRSFSRIREKPKKRANQYTLADCLMSGLAVFGLKSPSLLDFDQGCEEERVRYNLKQLYGVGKAPCDTQLRKRLDEVKPELLGRAYKAGFRALQRSKALPLFEFLEGYYLVSNDGTGVFESDKIHCKNCCKKEHRDGRTSYYHQVMSSVLVHPERSVVIPLFSEPILKRDGRRKNDCERNASKRLLTKLRKMHPWLKMVIVEDSLHSNAPHIRLLKRLNYRYIIGAKPKDHAWLFSWVNASPCQKQTIQRDGKSYELRWCNDAPLNESNERLRVNFLECCETDSKGKERTFTWVSDIPITAGNAYLMMRGARARWKIENETFNTLKNQGYHFEHNFGHGHKQLSCVMTHLMQLAFMVDQLQQLCCPHFQKALEKCQNKRRLWERMRHFVYNTRIECWEALFKAIVNPPTVHLRLDSS